MNAPYRQRVCTICASTSLALVACEGCGSETCGACQRDGACERCLDRAVTLILRRLATSGPGPIARRNPGPWWGAPLCLAAMASVGALAMVFVPRASCGPHPLPASASLAAQPVLFPAESRSDFRLRAGAASLLDDPFLGGRPSPPMALWERAKELSASGVPLTLVSVNVGRDVLDARGWRAMITLEEITPVSWATGRGVAQVLKISHVHAGSLLDLLGLREGDLITAVNGMDAEALAYRSLPQPKFSVLEVLRDGKQIVVGIHTSLSSVDD